MTASQLAQQFVDRIDQLHVVLDDLLLPLRQAVDAFRDVVARRHGKRRHDAQPGQIARRLGIVEELRVGDGLIVVEAEHADAHRFGVLGLSESRLTQALPSINRVGNEACCEISKRFFV